jgi:hypothetical protein
MVRARAADVQQLGEGASHNPALGQHLKAGAGLLDYAITARGTIAYRGALSTPNDVAIDQGWRTTQIQLLRQR